jgi:hypothetical protein
MTLSRNMYWHCTTSKLSYAQWNASELFGVLLCLTGKTKLIYIKQLRLMTLLYKKITVAKSKEVETWIPRNEEVC